MTQLVVRAQVAQLAKQLGVDASELESLERLGAPAIRGILERVSNLLFDEHVPTFARVSRLVPIMPTSLAAKIALKVMPAEVAGRAGGTVGLDHPDKMAGLLSGLTTTYMADAAPFLDPRVIPVLVARLPIEFVVPVANEIMSRRDYATTALFIEHSNEELIRSFERGIDDDEGLLHTAARTFSSDRLNEILRVLPEQRRARIITSSIGSDDEAVLASLSVLSRLERDLADVLVGEFFGALDDAALNRFLTVAITSSAVTELLDLSEFLGTETLQRIGGSEVLAQQSSVDAIAGAATNPRLRRAALAIAEYLPAEQKTALTPLVDAT
ncbi:hypothetical protein [Antrihabitans sp. YC2-6]|uniref:hypothetical protein n=1 Tax=Antrihabitans sp. YC2-6 TaxID=2799498 RepID=UPI0018F5DFDE|nr:hypothetical protein [Antrihabitans sp. YC2-6]MBJ8345219.1 hypothetical protein [Antrihabitans sp. YC2-6]